jgi:hypothetical protein
MSWRQIGGVYVQLHPFLTSELQELSSQLHTLAALPTGKNPGTHGIGDCMGPRAGPHILEKR